MIVLMVTSALRIDRWIDVGVFVHRGVRCQCAANPSRCRRASHTVAFATDPPGS